MEDSFLELLQSLSDENQPLDTARLAELSDLDQERLDRFTEAWHRLGEHTRQQVLREFGSMAESQIELCFEAINRMAVTDPEPAVREQAIDNLWESEDPGLVHLFLEALERDPSERVRSAAAKALGAFVLLGETRDLPRELSRAVEAGLLVANQGDPSDGVRERSLESLGFSSRAEVPRLIEQAYESGSESELRAALRAMAHSAHPRWIEHVLKRLNHPSPQVRLEAVQAAGEVEARQAVPELVELIDDVDDGVRRAAIWSIGQLGGPLAAEALGGLMESAEDEAEIELVQDALDNMDFVQSTRDLLRHTEDGVEGSAD